MKKWLVLVFFVMMSLAGCNEDEKLVRVDYQLSDMQTDDDGIIADEDQVKGIGALFEKVKWENAKVEMSRKEDMTLTLFYLYDPNMPERLEKYKIWFHDDRSAEFVDATNHRYGKLSREDAEKLKKQIK
ncbi:hypothetical protein AWM68_03110 [Fictibacillus phosphorivorans]|uniref:Lipoprotein n=1 Tax=Fictibacillus phosphorivorans TaxID=1221500 RepID=A0A161TS63_9BACL|nr:hypothetical protein [Fictibacillus phosphorivorans]KZE69271.1 hypothetical protein AWM68_03110 [Fictibacillus phosphorivorans]